MLYQRWKSLHISNAKRHYSTNGYQKKAIDLTLAQIILAQALYSISRAQQTTL